MDRLLVTGQHLLYCLHLYWTIVLKTGLSRKERLLINWYIYVPTITYGYELWVMTKRTKIHAVEMR